MSDENATIRKVFILGVRHLVSIPIWIGGDWGSKLRELIAAAQPAGNVTVTDEGKIKNQLLRECLDALSDFDHDKRVALCVKLRALLGWSAGMKSALSGIGAGARTTKSIIQRRFSYFTNTEHDPAIQVIVTVNPVGALGVAFTTVTLFTIRGERGLFSPVVSTASIEKAIA